MGGQSRRIATVVSGILRALSICTPALLEALPTLAQAFEPTALTADIRAEPLAQALQAFARQTGLQFVYVSGVVHEQRSHAVSAGLGANGALARMLEGTGLKFEYLTPRSIRILDAVVGPPRETTTTKIPSADELQEVIVTANRREENLQDVPMAIQVLTGETLAKLNATTFDDFVKYLPAVTAHGVGPGQSNIYVRGLGTAVSGIQGSGSGGTYPNVAVYLDEQSVQLPNRNLDIYAADLDRIEILEGPQGTLFGAGAQAGVVRYITNKPKLDVSEAMVNAGYATTAHGDQSSNVDATINIPLIADKLAVRGVIYNEKRGGYINNIPATFARANTDLYVHYALGGQVPANSGVINNFNIAGKDVNPVTYQGLRVAALYQFNEDWNALLTQSYQNMEADGVFAEMAADSLGKPQPDLSVQLYNPSYDKDKFENTALTINGRVGALKLVYAGAYLVRNVEQVQDYTNYVRALYVDYYQCVNRGPTPATAQCFTPSSTWHDVERNTHQSHELRVSTPGDERIRGIGGLFYENYQIQEQVDFFYLTALPYFNPVAPPTGYYTLNGSTTQSNGSPVQFNTLGAVFWPAPVTSNNPNVRPLGDGFFNDVTRGYLQKAAYASVDFDLVPQTLTLTAGTRYSRIDTSEVGSSVGSFGCQLPGAPNPCVNHSDFINLNAEDLDRTFSGFTSRANLSWKVTEDARLYYTWSQGFRAGGFNRSAFAAEFTSPLAADNNPLAHLHGGWAAPLAFVPDNLINNELGWKTMWMDRRIQWNGAIYQEDWNNAQINVGANDVISYGVILNGGNYRVRGLKTSGVARVTSGLTIEAGAAWNHSELVKQASFLWRDGTPIDFSALGALSGAQKLSNPGGALGSPLAGAPPLQGNIRARYELSFNGYEGFAQLDAVHQSHSLATTDQLSLDLQGNSIAYNLPAFTTYAGALGVGKNAWLVQVYGENLTDKRAQLYANYTEWYKGVTMSRPRTIGLRFSYKGGGR
ncbi:MAG: TonB-dependent receptor [Pseudomonadota bacterium]|nr:TonB-dependent receptor [Pseudomonadota bacterium]